MIDFKELTNKAIAHKAVLDAAVMDIHNNKVLIQEEQTKLDNLIHENQVTKFSYDYLDVLVKEESGRFIKSLNDMLNYAFKVIFYDCNYSIDIRVSQESNKATIHLIYEDENGNKVEPDIQNCGGGIRSVCGTILQCAYIFHYKAAPILFLDESLSQISSQYLPTLLELLDELAQKNNLKILLITHDTRLENADTVRNKYRIENGKAIQENKKEVTNECNSTE